TARVLGAEHIHFRGMYAMAMSPNGTSATFREVRSMSAVEVPAQAVDATQALNRSAGVWKPKVLRGRSLSCRATLLSCACLYTASSVPWGNYRRSRPLVFSLDPRGHGLCGSQK